MVRQIELNTEIALTGGPVLRMTGTLGKLSGNAYFYLAVAWLARRAETRMAAGWPMITALPDSNSV